MKLILLFCLLTISRARRTPNLAAIAAYDSTQELYNVVGAGTIVNPFWVLATGSHVNKIDNKFSRDTVQVIVGKWNLGSSGKRHSIDYVTTHEKFSDDWLISKFNIGLIRVKPKIEFNKEVQPAKISEGFEHVGDAVIAGWLLQNDNPIPMNPYDSSHSINVNIYDRHTCDEALKPILDKRSITVLKNYMFHSHLCTNPIADLSIQSNGYSGGPLMQKNPRTGRDEVIALTTNFTKHLENPVVHMKTSIHFRWIHDTIEIIDSSQK